MKRFYFLLLCAFLTHAFLTTYASQQHVSKSKSTQTDSIKIGSYIIKLIPVADEFGYDIYHNKKLFIHQPTIPAIPGNNGFTTKDAAEKVARKVIEKMQKGESLPTVTIDEMKQLGVTLNQ